MQRNSPENFLRPDREAWASDPFGYSVMAWGKWALVQTLAGFPIDPSIAPSSDDLKSPILWLCHARAMSDAAVQVLGSNPTFEGMPESMKAVCDAQYRSVGLMLVGYSLEICLKAMLITREGVATYTANEKKRRTHQLVELSTFIPGLSTSDEAILEALTHFVYWAGRYPDPGSGRIDKLEQVFSLAEKHRISAKELFELTNRVMKHADIVTKQKYETPKPHAAP